MLALLGPARAAGAARARWLRRASAAASSWLAALAPAATARLGRDPGRRRPRRPAGRVDDVVGAGPRADPRPAARPAGAADGHAGRPASARSCSLYCAGYFASDDRGLGRFAGVLDGLLRRDARARPVRRPAAAVRVLGADQRHVVAAHRLRRRGRGQPAGRPAGAAGHHPRRPGDAGRAGPAARQAAGTASLSAAARRPAARRRRSPSALVLRARRRVHQERAGAVPPLAARGDGRADAGVGLPARRGDGEGRRLPRRPAGARRSPSSRPGGRSCSAWASRRCSSAAGASLRQTDLKRLLAFGTVSQLGFLDGAARRRHPRGGAGRRGAAARARAVQVDAVPDRRGHRPRDRHPRPAPAVRASAGGCRCSPSSRRWRRCRWRASRRCSASSRRRRRTRRSCTTDRRLVVRGRVPRLGADRAPTARASSGARSRASPAARRSTVHHAPSPPFLAPVVVLGASGLVLGLVPRLADPLVQALRRRVRRRTRSSTSRCGTARRRRCALSVAHAGRRRAAVRRCASRVRSRAAAAVGVLGRVDADRAYDATLSRARPGGAAQRPPWCRRGSLPGLPRHGPADPGRCCPGRHCSAAHRRSRGDLQRLGPSAAGRRRRRRRRSPP